MTPDFSTPDPSAPEQLERYNETAQAAAAAVIGRYSTSFSAATNLLGKRCRTPIRRIVIGQRASHFCATCQR